MIRQLFSLFVEVCSVLAGNGEFEFFVSSRRYTLHCTYDPHCPCGRQDCLQTHIRKNDSLPVAMIAKMPTLN